MASPNDLYRAQHIEKGLGKYIGREMEAPPDFSALNKMFSNLSNPSLSAPGGSWLNPQEAQQMATPGYLSARGDTSASYLNNLFSLSALQDLIGRNMSGIAAMIPSLQAMQTRAGAGGFSAIAGGL